MHMVAILDYECLNCCWVNAHILDTADIRDWVISPRIKILFEIHETVVENMGMDI